MMIDYLEIPQSQEGLKRFANEHGVTLKLRSTLWLLRFTDWFSKVFLRIKKPEEQWCTTLNKTIYYPVGRTESDMYSKYCDAIEHEFVHVLQRERDGYFGFMFRYLFLWFPVFFAKFRFQYEAEAYLLNIVRHGYDLYSVVDCLWTGYLWPWPKKWMIDWFVSQTKRA